MKLFFALLVLLIMLALPAVGSNIALGCKADFDPQPDYGNCNSKDYGLIPTDGIFSRGDVWEEGIGWHNSGPNFLTIDLGKVQPISGLSYSMGAGPNGWPSRILMFVSDDGSTWKYIGDLIALAACKTDLPSPLSGKYVYRTQDLKTRGRYVRLGLLAQGGQYIVFDEVEIHRGSDSLLDKNVKGDLVNGSSISDFSEFVSKTATRRGVVNRLMCDSVRTRTAVMTAGLGASKRAALLKKLDKIDAAIPGVPDIDAGAFKAVFPLNDLHASIYAVNASIMKTHGLPDLFAWKEDKYAFITPVTCPAAMPKVPSISIDMMKNEHRSDALLLTNSSNKSKNVRLTLEGLPGGTPSGLSIYSVEWTDTANGVPIASALSNAELKDGTYAIPVAAGMTRKIWLAVDSSHLASGKYSGRILINGTGKPIRIPVSISVSKVSMGRPRLSLCVWDFMTAKAPWISYSDANRPRVIELMKSYLVDSHWTGGEVLPWPNADDYTDQNKLKKSLDFEKLDQWIRLFPDARNYMIFCVGGANAFAGAQLGTSDFNKRMGAWAAEIVGHMKTLGIDPKRLLIELIDEPSTDAQAENIVAWIDAMKSGAPEISVFEDPHWAAPNKSESQDSACKGSDIICLDPWQYSTQISPEVKSYFAQLVSQSNRLWFYACGGPAKLYDPYSVQRMFSWFAFAQNATGIGYWSYADNGGPNSWNEYASKSMSYAPYFLSPDGAIGSVHCEAIREGIEDYEYFAMLKDAAAKSTDASFRKDAEKLLVDIKAVAAKEYKCLGYWEDSKPASLSADDYRIKVLRLLENTNKQMITRRCSN